MPFTDAPITNAPAQPVTTDAEITEAHIYAAIADVLDPELDEPLVNLGFIDRVQVDGADVTVTFKLPTFWCSPNFAYLMAKDLRSRVQEVPGVRSVHVALLDHCAEDEVTHGVNHELSFAEAFPDETMEDMSIWRSYVAPSYARAFSCARMLCCARCSKWGWTKAPLLLCGYTI